MLHLTQLEPLARGSAAIDELLADIGLAKADDEADDSAATDPLKPLGFVARIVRLARRLTAVVLPFEQQARKDAQDALDIDWKRATPDQQDAAIELAKDGMRKAGDRLMPAVEGVLEVEGGDLQARTRRSTVRAYRWRIDSSLTTRDRVVGRAIAGNSTFYARDQYGRLADQLSELARRIVARGLEAGADSTAIGQDLAKMAGAAVRPPSYWTMLSTVFCGRARSATQLQAFDDAAIDLFVFSAVMDERTSNVCRLLNGKRFSVPAMLKRVRQAAVAKDPTDIEDLMPFVRDKRLPDGRTVMTFTARGRETTIAEVIESAVGKPDETGRFGKPIAMSALERAGVCTPPLHPSCRSSIVPA